MNWLWTVLFVLLGMGLGAGLMYLIIVVWLASHGMFR